MDIKNRQLFDFLELVNNYPSPHNGQPMQLVQYATESFGVYFEVTRGLSATPISYLFSFVTIGVFMRHLEYCAEALGHEVSIKVALPKQTEMAGGDSLYCGSIALKWNVHKPKPALQRLITTRQTSRKKYTSGLSESEKRRVLDIAAAHKIKATFTSNEQARQTIWLNQRAVFDDMFNSKVRHELQHWMRFSAAEKHAKRDGLSYDCMEMSGLAMRAGVYGYKVLHWPIVAPVLQKYYLRTMQDDSSVGYFMSPFTTELQAYAIGRCIIETWIDLTEQGYYLHPFGTIVSNERAHQDFISLVHEQHESRAHGYVVFIFRAGASPKPVESDRLPVAEHLYNQA